jgi:RNA polymerase sigma-32 factor
MIRHATCCVVNKRGIQKEESTMAIGSGERALMRVAMKAPYLERSEEHELALKWRDKRDQEALNKITMAHMRLVISMAAKFRHFGLSANDIIQEGYVGLMEAAARFEPDRDVRFSTYATWWIRAAMQDFVLRNWSIVRGGTSSTQKALFFNLRRLRAKISGNGERVDNAVLYREISHALGVSERDVAVMDSRLSAPDTSLNVAVSPDESDGADRMDFLISDEPDPDEIVADTIDSERRQNWLYTALGVLNERELRIIRKRRLAEEGATLEALGSELGISKERVRQIENRALEKIRGAILEEYPEMSSKSA